MWRKCVRGARNVEQLFVFFLQGSSTVRNRQVPRVPVGSSTISDEGLAVPISVMPISLFQISFFFFVRSGDCEKCLSLTDKKERHLTCVNTLFDDILTRVARAGWRWNSCP